MAGFDHRLVSFSVAWLILQIQHPIKALASRPVCDMGVSPSLPHYNLKRSELSARFWDGQRTSRISPLRTDANKDTFMKTFRQIVTVTVFTFATFCFAQAISGQTISTNEGFKTGRLTLNFNSDNLKTPTDDCKRAEMLVAVVGSKLPLPKGDWHFVVVCDEVSWQHLIIAQAEHLREEDRDPSKGEIYADTILDKKITIFRGYKLVHPDENVAPEHTIAHELAHIYLDSANENKVDRQADTWVSELKAGTTVASK
jgi:hypothetical protein